MNNKSNKEIIAEIVGKLERPETITAEYWSVIVDGLNEALNNFVKWHTDDAWLSEEFDKNCDEYDNAHCKTTFFVEYGTDKRGMSANFDVDIRLSSNRGQLDFELYYVDKATDVEVWLGDDYLADEVEDYLNKVVYGLLESVFGAKLIDCTHRTSCYYEY